MDKPIIQINNVSKKYRITHQQEKYVALRDVLTNVIKNPFSFLKNKMSKGSAKEDFWALKDISFNVEQGEAVGIIGPNGAGKTTLLKILSRITPPTKGEIRLRGRVASMLEVGTGFHPELTGRDNIFLNGAILGMSKVEIKKKFDEIVKFSGVEKFLDTPVKRYSSGMFVRLAFAVAAHLEPEILLIDEVLAVGDFRFQEKCLTKMNDITKKGGQTILFVSHNMVAIQSLCKRCVLLENGKIRIIGKTEEVVKKYLNDKTTLSNIPLEDRKDRRGKGNIRFKEIKLAGSNGNISNIYAIGDDIYIYAKIKNSYPGDVIVRLSLSIRTTDEVGLISCDSKLKGKTYQIPGASESTLVCRIYSPPLNYGDYYINLAIFHDNKPEDWVTSAAKFSIETGNFDNRATTNPFPILSRFEWDIENLI